MHRILLSFVVMATVACGATMVSKPAGANNQYAPVNDAQRGGVIKYRSDDASWMQDKRRQDAYKQMYEACSGAYRIDQEEDVVDGTVSSTTTNAKSKTATNASGGSSTVYYPNGKYSDAGANKTTETDRSVTTTTSSHQVHWWVIHFSCAGRT